MRNPHQMSISYLCRMQFEKIHNKGQAQLFKNQYLEYLTKTHPLVIWGMYSPVLILLPYYSFKTLNFSGLTVFLLALSGMIFWSFTEYVLHRFVFHYHPESERGKKLHYIIHGNHHEYPRDRERLFMPAAPSLIIASTLFLLMFLALAKMFSRFSRALYLAILFMVVCIMRSMPGTRLLNG